MPVMQTTTVPLPTMSDLFDLYSPPAADISPTDEFGGEVLAWGTAVYEGVYPDAYDSHRALAMQLARDYKPGDLWLLRSRERLPYPYAPFYAIGGMFRTEEKLGRRADWLLWIDDDVVVAKDVARVLRRAADPEERPFVAAVGYDRQPPDFLPAVWGNGPDGQYAHLEHDEVPASGIHRVRATGLCAAIFHRSLFDRVSEPWFAVTPPVNGQMGLNPDSWWCRQLESAGIPAYVTCDTKVIHLGRKITVSKDTAPFLAQHNKEQ
jgi:hypothetical protein